MAPHIAATADINLVEAPVTWKAYLMCAFASFGGIFFGYDIGYINSVLAMPYFIHVFAGLPYPAEGQNSDYFVISASDQSLITSILSLGTFVGAIVAGDVSDRIGRRWTIICGCLVFIIGIILQTASTTVALLSVGRVFSGFGVGFESSIVILYMSEIAPRKIRGALVSGYQFCITIGILLASCVDYGTQNRYDSGSYRIPIAIQFLWAIILGGGIALLPESPRYLVKRGRIVDATNCLASLRGQPSDSEFVQKELAEVIANHEYELKVVPQHSYWASWANCFKGSLWKPSSNLRRTILGTSLQMMQQWTGVNFIFYFGTTFFKSLGTIDNPFLISLITTLVNVCATPLSFWMIERFGRRPILIVGAAIMATCQYIVAIAGTAAPENPAVTKMEIAFICISIASFASTWGPAAWVVVGEVFPLPVRSRGVGLSTASNWLWNFIIALITPYLVGTGPGKADLKAKVFFIWASTCAIASFYAYMLVPETKGLTLEQVDKMLEETTPRKSSSWKPTITFAAEMGMTDGGELKNDVMVHVEDKEVSSAA